MNKIYILLIMNIASCTLCGDKNTTPVEIYKSSDKANLNAGQVHLYGYSREKTNTETVGSKLFDLEKKITAINTIIEKIAIRIDTLEKTPTTGNSSALSSANLDDFKKNINGRVDEVERLVAESRREIVNFRLALKLSGNATSDYCTGVALVTSAAKYLNILPQYIKAIAPLGSLTKEIPIIGSMIQHPLITKTLLPCVGNACTSYYILAPVTLLLCARFLYQNSVGIKTTSNPVTGNNTKNPESKDEGKELDEKKLMEQRSNSNTSNTITSTKTKTKTETPKTPDTLSRLILDGIKSIPLYGIKSATSSVLKHALLLAAAGYVAGMK